MGQTALEIGHGDFRAVGAARPEAENGGMAATLQAATAHVATAAPRARFRLRWLHRLERWALRAQSTETITEHLATGWRGELAAYFHLRRLGYIIVAQGWRSHIAPGDLDLVGWEGNRLCFVEVKTRGSEERATAESAVDEEKRRTLRWLARRYLRKAGVPEAAARFDVVTVNFRAGQEPEITLIRDAFGWRAQRDFH